MVSAFQYAVALTGGIATGKSTVATLLQDAGCCVIDADTIAHTILDEQSQAIISLFGEGFVHEGKVDRKALGALIFSDVSKRTTLEALLHPLIYSAIEQRATEEDVHKKPYFVDIPLFFETACYSISTSLLVYTPKEEQLSRLMQRNHYSKEEALSRIDAQMPIEEKRILASYIIDNSGTLAHLQQKTKKIIQEMCHDRH